MKLFNVRRRLIKPPSGGLIAGLDIGSSKVSCAIARLNPSGIPELVGFGHQASRGLRNGAIVDMEALATAVAAAVHAAEKDGRRDNFRGLCLYFSRHYGFSSCEC